MIAAIGVAVIAAAVENIRSATAEATASSTAPAAKAAPGGRAPAAASRFGRIALKATQWKQQCYVALLGAVLTLC